MESMDAKMILELVGYLGSGLVIISMLMTSVVRLRVINMIGSGIFMNWYYRKKIGLDIWYFWKDILRWTIPAALLCAAGWFVMKQFIIASWWTLIAAAAAYGVVYAGLLWTIGFRKEEKESIKKLVSALGRKVKRGGRA